MPGVYRKKKRAVGPSKNEEKVERARRAEAMSRGGNLLGARFPEVSKLSVRLQFLGAQQQSLGEETRGFGPNDACNFAVPCPGMCGVGSFDLAAKIEDVVGAHEAVSEASGVCQEVLATSGKPCSASLKCRIEVSYKAAPAA